MLRVRDLQIFCLLVFFSFTFMGCLALVVGAGAAGGVLYYKGSLKTELGASPDRVIYATNKAIADLQWQKISSSSSKTDGQATARTGTDKKVSVTVKQKTDRVSEIDIRIGTMGDENLSQALLDKIKVYL